MTFTIHPPIWQRTWFLASAVALLTAGLVSAHRARVRRLLAIERDRTRIASDLHDDIGTDLSQIAILAELLKRQPAGPAVEGPLARIADLSRESVDSLTDIVWSIDPGKDRFGNLTTRMRRLAHDLLSSRQLEVAFDVLGDPDQAIGADLRRDIYLSFKEVLHNIVRHAGCRAVWIELRGEERLIAFMVRDDGRGFDLAGGDGHGLSSLRRRADRHGGAVTIASSPGGGTRVELRVPRATPSFWFRRAF